MRFKLKKTYVSRWAGAKESLYTAVLSWGWGFDNKEKEGYNHGYVGTPPMGRMTDRQTRLKTLPFRNFAGGRQR